MLRRRRPKGGVSAATTGSARFGGQVRVSVPVISSDTGGKEG